MNKEYLDSLERLAMPDELHIKECKKLGIGLTEDYDVVEQALKRLEAIDNANPSEALECLEKVYSRLPQWDLSRNVDQCNIIKQALLKAQELVNENELLKAFISDCEKGDTPLKSALFREKKENELLKEIIKSLFDRGCPLHQYTDKEGMLLIEVDNECSTMHLGKFKGVDLDAKLKEVLE